MPVAAASNRLSAWYGRAQILFDVTLEVARGEVVALMGRNGAGKSTTLKAIMGLVERTGGTVTLPRANAARAAAIRDRAAGLGYVPEDRRIFSELTVLENLEVGRQPAARGRAGVVAGQAVPPVSQSGRDAASGRADSMSGGEQQMLTVARTLMGNPYLVLLDEPSEGIAPKIVEDMANMILELKREGLAVHAVGAESALRRAGERPRLRHREGAGAVLRDDGGAGGAMRR